MARIAVISPWAYVGFESVSHSTEEIKFRTVSMRRVLLISIISTTALYIFLTLLSATAFPPEYGSWLDYIRDRGNLSGMKGLPAFYAAEHYMGRRGVAALMLALLALIFTSLIGNITSISRLLYAMGRDGVVPRRLGELNRKNTPENAILLIVVISSVFPFLGRTAIGWIVDVTTIGATLIYGIVSASALRLALKRRDRRASIVAGISLACMLIFGTYLLIPTLYTVGDMAQESYFFFIVWAVLGFVYFRALLNRDKERRFGHSSMRRRASFPPWTEERPPPAPLFVMPLS